MNEKKVEIDTIKLRTYNLNLSDADVARLAKVALNYNLTAAELLENFIGDLIDGTYSNGSDERMYAQQWAERCYFSHSPKKHNLIMFLFGCENENCISCYTFEDIEKIQDRINECRECILQTQNEIKNPKDWKELVGYDHQKKKYVPLYKNVEQYIESEKECLKSYEDDLRCAEEELLEIKQDFNTYMNGQSYNWDEEIEKCRKWYQDNINNV